MESDSDTDEQRVDLIHIDCDDDEDDDVIISNNKNIADNLERFASQSSSDDTNQDLECQSPDSDEWFNVEETPPDTITATEDHDVTGSELQLYSQPLPGTSNGISPVGGTVATGTRRITTHISAETASDLLQAVSSSGWDTTVERDSREGMVSVHLTQNIIKDSAVNMGGKTFINPPGKKQKKQPMKQSTPTSAQRLRQTTESHIEEWTRGMVHTAATQSVLDLILQGKTWVTVTGSPGEGKTTAAYLTLKKLHTMGRQVYELRTPDDYFKVKDTNGPVLMFNDIFGPNHFSKKNLEKWQHVFNDILDMTEHRNFRDIGSRTKESIFRSRKWPLCVIFVIRPNVLNSATCHLGRFKSHILESVVNLTHDIKVSLQERLEIWNYHADMYHVSIDEATVIDVCGKNLSHIFPNCSVDEKTETDVCSMFLPHGFPHCCRLFASMYSQNKKLSMEMFFLKPIEFLNQTMESLLADSKIGPLLREMLKHDGRLELDSITDDEKRYHFKTVAVWLKGTYLSEEKDSVTFHHSSVYDSAAFVVCKTDPLFVIRHCSLSFLNERVRFQGLESEEESLMTITIDSKYTIAYTERLKLELADENISQMLSHASFNDKGFVEKFMKTIHSDSQVLTEPTFIQYIIHKFDKDTKQSFLFHSTNNRSEKLLSQQEQADALFGICQNSSVSSLLFLLSRLDDESLKERFSDYDTLLMISSTQSSSEILTILIEKGADVTVRDNEGNSVLNHICENGVDDDGDVVRLLIDKGVDGNWKSENYLHQAVIYGHENVVRALTDKGADINKSASNGRSPVLLACLMGYSHIMGSLLNKGSDINMADNQGIKPLHYACIGGHIHVITALLDRGADINQSDKNGCTILHFACERGHVNIMAAVIDRGVNVNQTDNDGRTALHFACIGGHLNVMIALLDKGADINQTYKDGYSVLHCTCLEGHVEVMAALLDMGLAINQTNENGSTALHSACEGGHVGVMKALLDRGVDINQTDTHGHTGLHCACESGQDNVITDLLEKNVDINRRDKDGRTAFDYACRGGYFNVITALLDRRGVCISQKDENGSSTFHYACLGGNVNIVTTLVDRGVDINVIDMSGRTAFHFACQGGHVDVMADLLDRGLDINQRDTNCSSGLHYACKEGHVNIMTALLDKGVDINQTDNKGESSLHYAGEGGHVNVMTALLDRGVDINQTDESGLTALHYAGAEGNINFLTALLDRGVDINQTDKSGLTVLHYASSRGHVNTVTALLNMGVDINKTDNIGFTALQYACDVMHSDVVTPLLDGGVNIKQTDENGRTCVHPFMLLVF